MDVSLLIKEEQQIQLHGNDPDDWYAEDLDYLHWKMDQLCHEAFCEGATVETEEDVEYIRMLSGVVSRLCTRIIELEKGELA